MDSPIDPYSRDDHLRSLLDQRTARADIHGRFPSLSEFSDSPSVYSRAHFSPRPTDRSHVDTNFEFVVPVHVRPSEPRSLSDRERLNFPNASSLDLDDDPTSSCACSNSHDGEDLSGEDEDEPPRISTYGPKMTVHSRAPWELGEDDVTGPDDHGSSSKLFAHKRPDGPKRGVWPLGKNSTDKRPSTESSRSQPKAKQSLDSHSPTGGALLALAQASMSSTSLSLTSSPQPTLRDKLSLSRLRSRTPSNPNPPGALEPIEARLPPFPPSSNSTSPMSRLIRATSPVPLSPLEPTFSDTTSRASSPNIHQEYTHPYANPDLVRRVVYDPPQSPKHMASSVLPQTLVAANHSDSNATLTETTTTSSIFQSRSNTAVSSLTPVTSSSSMDASVHEYCLSDHVHGKGISTPTSVSKSFVARPSGTQEKASGKLRNRDTKLLSGPASSAFPGWSDNSTGSSIKLISLEEAQAQARERSRSATANPVISSPLVAGPPSAHIGGFEHNMSPQSPAKRTRSASAGGLKAKVDSGQRPLMPTDSSQIAVGSVSQRTVTRKKSGFMRLFNAKERDRALHSPPPPIPSLSSDSVTVPSNPVPQVHRMRKASTHRVPVPSLSPSLVAAVENRVANADSGSSSDSRSDASVSKESVLPRDRQLSSRRNAPDLSIVTSPPTVEVAKLQAAPPHTAAIVNDLHGHTVIVTPTASESVTSTMSQLPSSAPPGMTDFVALRLRPVSTLFSTGFADQLVSPDALSQPSLDTDSGTPTTATTSMVSPLSPNFPPKAYAGVNDGKVSPMITEDDQSSIVQPLPDQILVARRAWQRQIWELEGQVRDLKAEVEELRTAEKGTSFCAVCGRGSAGKASTESDGTLEDLKKAGVKVGVVNRPRARTGVGSRFASGT
ncbi:uncharacterized protein FIBRA_01004 [Fibroporia radiculosa]|uniref:Uncharacterized protein n=1 Tax=Fibroporia radiculosa TaxID=599839 RepID=J4I890_9APHY|nr:uncharacterized protein FIBRA_01004 [Fibroporia radiculosa]CCL98996.1 predicted protein [Fibroporia radiculosa]